MSIRVLFFASIREAAGLAEIELPAEYAISLEELMGLLGERLPDAGMAAIRAENVRVAVNQTLGGERSAAMRIGPDDEVAFLPPVTGG
ncbi:MAG TPA: MoaD/ThiS family protein [Pseudomonadales bacterium]